MHQKDAAPSSGGTGGRHSLSDNVGGFNSPPRASQQQNARQLDLFAIRCRQLAEQVDNGIIYFLDAVDTAYSAAEWSGMVELYGDGVVQKIMAAAFMRARRRVP
jgi:hypothetical protein